MNAIAQSHAQCDPQSSSDDEDFSDDDNGGTSDSDAVSYTSSSSCGIRCDEEEENVEESMEVDFPE